MAMGMGMVISSYPRHDYYLLTCLGPAPPHHTILSQKNSSFSLLLESPSSFLSNIAWPVTKYLTIPLQSGQHLHAKLLLPPDLVAGDGVKYPLLLNMYGQDEYSPSIS